MILWRPGIKGSSLKLFCWLRKIIFLYKRKISLTTEISYLLCLSDAFLWLDTSGLRFGVWSSIVLLYSSLLQLFCEAACNKGSLQHPMIFKRKWQYERLLCVKSPSEDLRWRQLKSEGYMLFLSWRKNDDI